MSPEHQSGARGISRRSFVGGIAAGAAGTWALSRGLFRLGDDPARPPQLYEYFLDNFWFEAADLEHQSINAPLKGAHKADIVILGGGFTGLSSAFHLIQKFPNRKIMLLEGACCGYGASGRNGGFCNPGMSGFQHYLAEAGPEAARKTFDLSLYGIGHIKRLIAEHGVLCDFEESGMLLTAIDEAQARQLENVRGAYKSMGLDSTLVQGSELKAEIDSSRYVAALKLPYGGIINPAKLARGAKAVVEQAGVEICERTLVIRVTPGRVNRVETEMGEVSAPVLVLGLNGYSPRLGFFQDRVMPLCNYVMATEPLSREQWQAIGWQHRQGVTDMRVLFDYQRPTTDGRIVIGGSGAPYFAGDAPSSGNYKPTLKQLTKSFFATFPQLEGLRIAHAWGGTMAFTRDFTPSVGIMGEYRNIYYGVAYNGEGVAFTQTAGRIIAELVAGEQSEFTRLFVVNHRMPYLGPSSARFLFERLYRWYLTRGTENPVR